MNASYHIDVDPGRSLVRATLSGFFMGEDVARFTEARDRAHHQLRCAPNHHVTLVDVRGMTIQSQESVAEFQKVLANRQTAGKRIAFVVARSLARMQTQRVAQGRNAAYFDTVEAAEAWLFSDESSAAA